MADLLSTGVSGLLASQVGLSTVGHNISNQNTVGYTRQTTTFNARNATNAGSYYIGQGVDAVSVQRSYSQYLTQAVWSATAGQSRATTYSQLTSSINNTLSGSSNLQTALDAFFSSVSSVANAPTDTASRQALLGKASSLVSTYTSLSNQFNSLNDSVNDQIKSSVQAINGLAASIADLNSQIQKASYGGAIPNDLMDARDNAIEQLSGYAGVSVIQQSDNTINVSIGSGQSLVNGTQAFQLTTAQNQYDASQLEILGPGGGNLTNQFGDGALGALVDFRSNVLNPARNQLGRGAIAMATAFNAQHVQGIDLKGKAGSDFFSVTGPTVLSSTKNTGTSSGSASITDVSQLTSSDYVMRFDGTNWSMSTTDGRSVPMTGTGTATDPFKAEGLSVTVSGVANAGDSFEVMPTRNAAAGVKVLITDTNKIAASGPLSATKASTNTGAASITGGMKITDATNANLNTPANIVFTSATTYTINGGAPQSYASGTPIQANGWSLTLSGTPAIGDTFSVNPAGSGSGDNGNALALADVANKGILDNGVTTIGKSYSQLTAAVGVAGQQATTALATQTSIYNQAASAQQSVSGVNLDEEAANLIRFQQAYSASAQVINTANTIFNALLTAVQS
ncbi:flagellar hook-associated protein 1 FlgK [Luteibacter sp. Sphag1AF]|uniref:flagellar hook-associated protein FlgK n=1 Tax=Luteibacter sp. Sphag1AF TaxID=2587031 RepID=UPI0016152760|nr:flagellar hook-associated protein FlgK [Luteibacter sp. Sphag1AF]MBB3225606.1 flagellar hook-associated protein 1 FlgK [Luteibacter sp. Sphag1AF]